MYKALNAILKLLTPLNFIDMSKKDDEPSDWLFIELGKVAFAKDEEVTFGMRVVSLMASGGMMILEPPLKLINKIRGED